jgi:hypothetical protein
VEREVVSMAVRVLVKRGTLSMVVCSRVEEWM